MTEQTPAAVDDELVESQAANAVEETGVPVPDGSDEQLDGGDA